MTASGITQLIINSPYEKPQRHWRYERETWNFKSPSRQTLRHSFATHLIKTVQELLRYRDMSITISSTPGW